MPSLNEGTQDAGGARKPSSDPEATFPCQPYKPLCGSLYLVIIQQFELERQTVCGLGVAREPAGRGEVFVLEGLSQLSMFLCIPSVFRRLAQNLGYVRGYANNGDKVRVGNKKLVRQTCSWVVRRSSWVKP